MASHVPTQMPQTQNVLPWEVYTQKQVHAAVHQSLQATASMATLASGQAVDLEKTVLEFTAWAEPP